MKDGKVKVIADEAGNVIRRSSNNPKYGNIRVAQERFMIDDNGFLRPKRISALIAGTVENLEKLNLSAGEEIDGRVIVKLSLTPFNEKEPGRDFKRAGESEIVCTMGDAPIYMKTFFSFDPSAQDVTTTPDGTPIQHTNGDEIKAWYAANKKKSSAVKPNGDFSL